LFNGDKFRKKMKIYLDNAATTKVDKKVIEKIEQVFLENYGNPSSKHSFGQRARSLIDKTREIISKKINCDPSEIIFTSGGTESDNLALNILEKGDHLIISEIEHPAIFNKALDLEKSGVEVTYLKVDKDGFVIGLEDAIKKNTKLVSIMHANNEVGTIQDLEKIGEICSKNKIIFHSDCVQTFNKEEIDVKKMNLSMISGSSHKIHGPKGIGFLYCNKKVKLRPLILGGGQELKIRNGTENVSGIVGFGEAINLNSETDLIKKLRDYFIYEIEKNIENVKLNGSRLKRLANNINFSFKRVEGEAILMSLDLENIYVSTGSACSSKNLKASRVLLAMGLDHATAHGSIRFSLSKYNTKKEIDVVVEKLKIIIKRLRRMSAL